MKEKALFDGGLSIRVGRKRIFDSDDCTRDSFSLRFTFRPFRQAKNAISLIVYLDFNAKKRNSFIKQKYSITTSVTARSQILVKTILSSIFLRVSSYVTRELIFSGQIRLN